MSDVEKRRARQRAYWSRHRAAKSAERARAVLSAERIETLRERDRGDYSRRRVDVLAVKRKRRAAEPEAVRALARTAYRARTPTVEILEALRQLRQQVNEEQR